MPSRFIHLGITQPELGILPLGGPYLGEDKDVRWSKESPKKKLL